VYREAAPFQRVAHAVTVAMFLYCNNEDEMGWVCSTHGIGGISYIILVGKPEERRPLRNTVG
jgi:hypothetical protein